jgi:sugar phosphate isomerase/epimerase
MKIGISTTDFSQMPAADMFRLISGFGFNVIQLSLMNLSESNFISDGLYEIPETVDGKIIRAARLAKDFGLDIAAINGTFNMAYPDPHARDEGVRRFAALAEAAGDIGCNLVTLCSGTRNKTRLWAYHKDNAGQSAWDDMMDTMLRLTEIAEKFKIILAIETEASNVIDTPEKARKALDNIKSDRVGMIMDCANLFRRGEAKRANVDARIRRAFELFGDRVVLAHGKDIMESADNPDDEIRFCAAGEGIVNFGLFFQLLDEYGYTGDLILHGIRDIKKIPGALAFIKLMLPT